MNRAVLMLLGGWLAVLVAASAARLSAEDRHRPTVTTTLVDARQLTGDRSACAVSDGQGRLWYQRTSGGRLQVCRDGALVATFAQLEQQPRRHSGLMQISWPEEQTDSAPVYVGVEGGQRYVLTPQGQFGPFDQVGRLRAVRAGDHWACFVRRDGRWALLHDGQLRGWHQRIGWPKGAGKEGADRLDGLGVPYLSDDGQHAVWQTLDDGRPCIRLDDQAWPLAGSQLQVPRFELINDGRELLYRQSDGLWYRRGERLSAQPVSSGR